jgi:hypothetical protein
MTIRILDFNLAIHNIHTRIPFRYGIAELIAVPHLFVRLLCEVDDHTHWGISADSLIPKWFTKNISSSYQADLEEMLDVIQHACQIATSLDPVESIFELWQQVSYAQEAWAVACGYPALLWNFGVSLVERAAIDGFCRVERLSFSDALRNNRFGIRLSEIHAGLENSQPADWLPGQPLESVIVRHTVGLSDPISEDDIQPDERVNDGLPQSLEANIRYYGLTHFKLKIQGDLQTDLMRLKRIQTVLEKSASKNFAFTLDGNEQFTEIEQFQAFWLALRQDPDLKRLLDHLLFVEQPLYREVAFCDENYAGLKAWRDRPAMIIDESDSSLNSLETALDCGYNGTSHKNCKGVLKHVANACWLEYLRRNDSDRQYLLSGEDLANIGPIALLQDLAVMANLGIAHVERNGHHYFSGLSMFPSSIQAKVAHHHPDLYDTVRLGFPTLKIASGLISTRSVIRAPFGPAFSLDLAEFVPLEQWDFNSLEI